MENPELAEMGAKAYGCAITVLLKLKGYFIEIAKDNIIAMRNQKFRIARTAAIVTVRNDRCILFFLSTVCLC